MSDKSKGALAFDLDGTLAMRQHPFNPYTVGEPVLPILDLALEAVREGRKVYCFTARASSTDPGMHRAVREWLDRHGLEGVRITNWLRGLLYCFMMMGMSAQKKHRQHHWHGLTKSREHSSWGSMLQRCTNPEDTGYKDYGGRGIKVCARWDNFMHFLADMGPRPAGFTLERKDVNGDYTPDNCIWASTSTQARNRRSNIRLSVNGVDKIATDWALELGLKRANIYQRKKKGWSDADALSVPVGSRVGRPAALVVFRGESKSLPEWSKVLDIPWHCLFKRLNKYGWTLERALSTPVDTSRHTKKRQAKGTIV